MNYKAIASKSTFYIPTSLQARFRSAAKGQLPARQWVRDVFETFADNADLQLSQAVMIFVTGQTHCALNMHARAAAKADRNSDHGQHLTELSNMLPQDHEAFIRKAFDSALDIRYGG